MRQKQEIIFHELVDIFDEIHYDKKGLILTKPIPLIRTNITEVLKREKLWHKGFTVEFSMRGLKEITAQYKSCTAWYHYDYQVYDAKTKSVIASGTCYGNGTLIKNEDKTFTITILDMQLELIEYNLDRLRRKTEREIVVFC